MRRTDEERFWSKVDRTGEHWLWLAGTAKGYGRFRFGGRNRLAHQVAWELVKGLIPEGMFVDHPITCPTTCVNPHHLRLATHKQNMENRRGAPSHSHSGVRGVRWDRSTGRWRGRVKHNGKVFSLGGFSSLEEAEAAVVAKRNELFTHNDADRL